MSCSFPSFPLQFQPPTPSVTWSPHASGQPKTLQSYHCLSGQSPWRHCLRLQKLRTSLVVSTCLKLLDKSWNIALIEDRIIIFFFEIEIAWNHPPDNMFNRGKPNKHNDQANFGEWLVSDRMITLQRTLSKKTNFDPLEPKASTKKRNCRWGSPTFQHRRDAVLLHWRWDVVATPWIAAL